MDFYQMKAEPNQTKAFQGQTIPHICVSWLPVSYQDKSGPWNYSKVDLFQLDKL